MFSTARGVLHFEFISYFGGVIATVFVFRVPNYRDNVADNTRYDKLRGTKRLLRYASPRSSAFL